MSSADIEDYKSDVINVPYLYDNKSHHLVLEVAKLCGLAMFDKSQHDPYTINSRAVGEIIKYVYRTYHLNSKDSDEIKK